MEFGRWVEMGLYFNTFQLFMLVSLGEVKRVFPGQEDFEVNERWVWD